MGYDFDHHHQQHQQHQHPPDHHHHQPPNAKGDHPETSDLDLQHEMDSLGSRAWSTTSYAKSKLCPNCKIQKCKIQNPPSGNSATIWPLEPLMQIIMYENLICLPSQPTSQDNPINHPLKIREFRWASQKATPTAAHHHGGVAQKGNQTSLSTSPSTTAFQLGLKKTWMSNIHKKKSTAPDGFFCAGSADTECTCHHVEGTIYPTYPEYPYPLQLHCFVVLSIPFHVVHHFAHQKLISYQNIGKLHSYSLMGVSIQWPCSMQFFLLKFHSSLFVSSIDPSLKNKKVQHWKALVQHFSTAHPQKKMMSK